ncbi:MAG: hypothetical protein QOF16_1812, partial [Actinomycetota bacterium]|nr:hypothetical protein [Actinomycetota bacterium]
MLSASHRMALLSEIGDGATTTADSEATRMLRMRARRRLAAILEKASAILLPVRWTRLSELAEWAFGSRQAALSTVSCLLCVALGTVTALTTVIAVPHASAQTTRERRLEAAAVRLQAQALPSHAGLARSARRDSTLRDGARPGSRPAGSIKHSPKHGANPASPSTLPDTPPLPEPPKAPPLPAPPPLPKAPLPVPSVQDAFKAAHHAVNTVKRLPAPGH